METLFSHTFILFHIICEICQVGTINMHVPNDYCTADVFEPRCNTDEVVMIESAVYGRMAPGKCFPKEDGNFGCSIDVKSIMDSLCSGRQTCVVPTLNKDLYNTKPCGPSTVGYLSIAYTCIKGANSNLECTDGISKIEGTSGYLSPTFQQTSACPLLVEVPSGRLITFTAYTFMRPGSSACYEVAVIKENNRQKSIHVCPSDSRSKVVHVTDTSRVTIELSKFNLAEEIGSFLLHYEATGCPSPVIPVDAHTARDGERAKIVCNDSDTSWFTYCKNNVWTEQDRQCPKSHSLSEIFETKGNFPYGIFLTSVIGVGVGIFTGGFLLFLSINAFQRYQRRKHDYQPPIIPDADYKIYDTAKLDFVVSTFSAGRNILPTHQMAPPAMPPPLTSEEEKRFSRHTYEKPKYNSDNHLIE